MTDEKIIKRIRLLMRKDREMFRDNCMSKPYSPTYQDDVINIVRSLLTTPSVRGEELTKDELEEIITCIDFRMEELGIVTHNDYFRRLEIIKSKLSPKVMDGVRKELRFTKKQVEIYEAIMSGKQTLVARGVGLTTVLKKIVFDYDLLGEIINDYIGDEKTINIVQDILKFKLSPQTTEGGSN